MRFLLAGLALILTPALSFGGDDVAALAQNETGLFLPDSLLQISETDAFSKYVFLVDKEKRKLSVFERSGENIKKVDEYPTDIGKSGGNKTRRDDHKTPEGIYFLEKKLTQPEIPHSLYGVMAFTTNYPNLFDRRENKTGSGIWLHAIPESVALTRGSKGCVVVRNEVIKKLENYIKLRETPILIFDHVNYVSKEEHEKRRKALSSFVESWRQAWENQDLDKYMNFYADDFQAPGFDRNSWRAHKARLKSQYEFIKVGLSQPYIVQHNEQLLVKTLQRYESNKHVDYGVKTIYAVRKGDSFEIIREEWQPFSQKSVTAAIAKETAPNSPTAQANSTN